MNADLRYRGPMGILLVLAIGCITPAQAQVVSLTVGLTSSCPYGVPN